MQKMAEQEAVPCLHGRAIEYSNQQWRGRWRPVGEEEQVKEGELGRESWLRDHSKDNRL